MCQVRVSVGDCMGSCQVRVSVGDCVGEFPGSGAINQLINKKVLIHPHSTLTIL